MKMMNKLSCRLEVLPGQSLRQKLECAREFGFDAVAFSGRYRHLFANALLKIRLAPVEYSSLSLGFEGSLLSPSRAARKKCRQSLLALFDFCGEAGIPTLNMPPVLNQDNLKRIVDAGKYDSLKERLDALLLDQLPEIGDQARRRGVVLALEPVNRYESDYLHTIGHAARLCRKVNHPHLGVTADFFHMQMEELSVPGALSSARACLKLVHAAENNRMEPGPGSMDFEPGFKTLHRIGYTGFIEVECRNLSGPPQAALPNSARYLRRLLWRARRGKG